MPNLMFLMNALKPQKHRKFPPLFFFSLIQSAFPTASQEDDPEETLYFGPDLVSFSPPFSLHGLCFASFSFLPLA